MSVVSFVVGALAIGVMGFGVLAGLVMFLGSVLGFAKTKEVK